MRLESDDLPGFGRAQYFRGTQRRELKSGKCWNVRIRLRDSPRELRGRFEEQNSGKKWFAGKMASQKCFVPAHGKLANAASAPVEPEQAIEKTELGSMGQSGQGCGQSRLRIIFLV